MKRFSQWSWVSIFGLVSVRHDDDWVDGMVDWEVEKWIAMSQQTCCLDIYWWAVSLLTKLLDCFQIFLNKSCHNYVIDTVYVELMYCISSPEMIPSAKTGKGWNFIDISSPRHEWGRTQIRPKDRQRNAPCICLLSIELVMSRSSDCRQGIMATVYISRLNVSSWWNWSWECCDAISWVKSRNEKLVCQRCKRVWKGLRIWKYNYFDSLTHSATRSEWY